MKYIKFHAKAVLLVCLAMIVPQLAMGAEGFNLADHLNPEKIMTYTAFLVMICSALTTVVPGNSKGGAIIRTIKAILDAFALNFGHAANGLSDSVQVPKK